ncbi:sodium-dependent neutral amino acid transporter B(0)AT2-like [Dendronephthya gigantea]|uniref:sodium-dependent neutral amino acid transporter B(0)AT2-like n=1 Tax=Dendronephthya gigantea TaxID=151771 RepID=UPI0010695E4F|nr:sodium-dependent neutral amino acid transporter B(0)AT2-like [Dendronephthya gigantea]
MSSAKVKYVNHDDDSSQNGPPSYSESDRERFETQTPADRTRNKVQLPRGMENTFTRGSYTPSEASSTRGPVSPTRSLPRGFDNIHGRHTPSVSGSMSNKPKPAAKINFPKGMENIMTSRPSRYAVDRSVDPDRSPPPYKSPRLNQTDAPYSSENIVQPRHSASYNTGTLPWQQDVTTVMTRDEEYPLTDGKNNDEPIAITRPTSRNIDPNAGRSTDRLDESVEEERDAWGSKWEFILASIGLAVGLGNVWRFPYLCQKNGGGVFLIPYIIFMFIEGIPLMLLEFAIGQKFRMTAVSLWKTIHPALFGVGLASLAVSLFLCVYYIVVIAWCFLYFFISMQKDLPWKIDKLCDNYTDYKFVLDEKEKWSANKSFYSKPPYLNNSLYYNVSQYAERKYNESIEKINNFPDCCVIDPPQWYFYTEVLDVSTDIDDYSKGVNLKLFGCLVLAWIVVFLCVVKGIKSSGKVVYFTAVFPYVILIILFFRGVTLEGAGIGLEAFFSPEGAWERLGDVQVWKDAATQMFFTLSLAFGALIAFASYMPKNNQCMNDAYTVVFINCGTSLFAGVVVYSILGYRQVKTGIPANKVGSGPGLAFMAFSDALLQLDLSPFWAVLFFFMLILLGIDSEFGTLEAAITPMMEIGILPKKWRKEVNTAIVVVVMLLIGIAFIAGNGFYVFQIFDGYAASLPLLIVAFFQCIAVAWIYGNDRFSDDIEEMTGKRPWIGWMICWKYISPLALLIVVIATVYDLGKESAKYDIFVGCVQAPVSNSYSGTKEWTSKVTYPGWGQFIVALVILVPTVAIIFYIIYKWPKNWKESFHKMFCTGINNYLPDPDKDE